MNSATDKEISVLDMAYDRDDVINALHEIEELVSPENHVVFKFWANEIECATDYLIARLRHSENERFK